MMNKERALTIKFIGAFLIMTAMFLVAITFGAADTSLRDVFRAIFTGDRSSTSLVLIEIRFPREVAAIVVGAGLAVSGAIMQGMTRNPLADPGLLGLTAGANAALAVAFAFIPGINYMGIIAASFVGAAVGAGLVFGIASLRRGGFSPIRVVLAGAAVSAFLFAIAEGIALTFRLSQNVAQWTAGGLIGTTWSQLNLLIPITAGGILAAILFSKQLTILSLSEEVAVGLGSRIGQVKAVFFVLTVILAGSAVALAGNLAFAGLLVPHIVRSIVGTDYRYILPMCVLVGGTFMLFADTAGRLLNAPFETPVAAIVSVLGLPFFLYVVRKGVNMSA
ncbi:iron ABC transporter permease [Jeotgalibacillus sp. R-1-5s-1]|uniref:FecCD family ABC transporter permease n=1 Tax=Jeotgalibacillus sp. R-1-5s-1 TaxID=2555897 RepID=UPI001069BB9E|nr:iron ABC transporter permease [Jeotgalibacillus sp. R-1-5s-1]TFD99685.1 iron ABC transporter permease [Jeotgalibacillus sp. R-1-5s-1]